MTTDNDSDRKHSDPFDIASQIEQEATSHAIHSVQKLCKRDQEEKSDGSYEQEDCDECGLEIGYERLKVAIRNKLCVHCASAQEKRAKGRGWSGNHW